ncbi:heparanase-like [Oncorhynchus masou masou]|uniref:heparanase-like n=1 Tax=Oncorhynchus masou masou TaxID=90313 RepID=UPI003183FA7F
MHLAPTVDLASPGKKVWLGESSSAYGGGAKGLSDTFVAGFITSYKSGAVTLFALNLSKSPVRIAVLAMVPKSPVEAFVLQSEQPGEEGLYSKSVKLNREVLKMVDDRTLPSLQGTPLAAGEHLRLPGYSFA